MLRDDDASIEEELGLHLSAADWNPATIIDRLLGEIPTAPVAEHCQNLETLGVKLLNRVDALIHSSSANIDGLLDGLTKSLPKLEQDLRLLRYRSDQLVGSIDKLNIEESSSSELSELRRMHKQKEQLAEELAVLIDVDAWNGLEADVGAALNQGNYLLAAKKPEHPSYSARAELLHTIKQKVEGHYREPFASAVSTKDGSGAKLLFSAYRIFGATEKPIVQYAKQTSKSLSTTPITRPDDLGLLCTELYTYVRSELAWALDVFKEFAPGAICATLVQAIGMAKPGIQKYFEQHPQSQYSDAVDCHHFIDQLLKFAEGTILTDISTWAIDNGENFFTDAEVKRSQFDRILRPVLVDVANRLRGAIDWLLPYQLAFAAHEEALIRAGTRDALALMVRCLKFTLGFGVDSLPSLMFLLYGELLAQMENSYSRIRADFILAHLKPGSDTDWGLFNAALKLFAKSVGVSLQVAKSIDQFTVLFWPLKSYVGMSVSSAPALQIQQLLYGDAVKLDDFDETINFGSLTSLTLLSDSGLNDLELRKFLEELAPGSPVCFINTLEQLAELQTSLLRVQFDILFLPLESRLKAYRPEPKPKADPSRFPTPKFSLAPTSDISSLGEKLLTLTQRLEPYTSELGLFKYMFKLNTQLKPQDVLEVATPLDKTEVLQTWVASLVQGAMALFLKKVNETSGFSLTQIRADAAYLINVVTALGVTPSFDLGFLSALSGMELKRYLSLVEALTPLNCETQRDKGYEILSTYAEFNDDSELCQVLMPAADEVDPHPGKFVRKIINSPDGLESLLRSIQLVSSMRSNDPL
ncbi:hypothetical protein L0F63_004755 [Massospora cicadina]|nr:hypothetical protein L0F63_004755 [Massospora cicadina]